MSSLGKTVCEAALYGLMALFMTLVTYAFIFQAFLFGGLNFRLPALFNEVVLDCHLNNELLSKEGCKQLHKNQKFMQHQYEQLRDTGYLVFSHPDGAWGGLKRLLFFAFGWGEGPTAIPLTSENLQQLIRSLGIFDEFQDSSAVNIGDLLGLGNLTNSLAGRLAGMFNGA